MAQPVDCVHMRDECVNHVSNVTTNVQVAVSLLLCFCCFTFSYSFHFAFQLSWNCSPISIWRIGCQRTYIPFFSLNVYSFFTFVCIFHRIRFKTKKEIKRKRITREGILRMENKRVNNLIHLLTTRCARCVLRRSLSLLYVYVQLCFALLWQKFNSKRRFYVLMITSNSFVR